MVQLTPPRALAALVILLSLAGPLTAQAEFTDTQLQGELWIPLQPILPGELERRATDTAMLEALLEEMQTVFSGMVYGWSFTYRPVDPDRKVTEFLEVTPLGRIAGTTGDPKTARARAIETRVDEASGVLTVVFRYAMPTFESARRKAWASSIFDQSIGTGKANAVDRLESRVEALKLSLKEAVRALLRPRYLNRPQEIRGEALLREVPRYSLQSGQYVCTARFQIRIVKVREYPLY